MKKKRQENKTIKFKKAKLKIQDNKFENIVIKIAQEGQSLIVSTITKKL